MTNCWSTHEANLITILPLQAAFITWTGEANSAAAANHVFSGKHKVESTSLTTWAIVGSSAESPHIRELGPSGNYRKGGKLTLRLTKVHSTPTTEELARSAMVNFAGELIDQLGTYLIQNGEIPVRTFTCQSVTVTKEKYRETQRQVTRADISLEWMEW